MKLPTIDFETRGDAGYRYDFHARKWRPLQGFDAQKNGLKAVGVYVYVEHHTFQPQLLAYNLTPWLGEATEVQWELGEPFDKLAPLFDYIRSGGVVEGFNVEFERTVWNRYCVPVWNWPPLPITQTRCAAAASRSAGWPGALAEVARLMPVTQKDPDGDRLMKIFSFPRTPTKADPRTHVMPREAPEDWAKYKTYNRIDIRSEFEVSSRLPDFTPWEQENWFMDQEINERGMAVDRAGISNAIAVVEQAYEKYGAEHRALTGGIEPTELAQVRDWLARNGLNLPNMQAATIEAVMERLRADPARPAAAFRALELREMLGSASVKKLYALDAATCRDGRVRGMYMFLATHHGRTNGYGPQPANLYKGEWHETHEVDAALGVLASRNLATVEAAYPNLGALDVVNNCMRSLFIAGPGMRLVSSDYTAIEAVCLAALAGEQWVLDVFHTHGMIYEATISKMTGIPFQEFIDYRVKTGGVATYGPDGKLLKIRGGKHHPLRQQGKLADLSGGYASWIGGWKKFGADKYYDGDKAIKAAIMSYRESKPAVVELWGGQTRDKFRHSERQEYYGLEGAAIKAVLQPGSCFRVGLIAFQVAGDALYMQLPSGRLITYHYPRLTQATRDYASPWELALSYEGWNTNPNKGPPGWMRMDLYGGVLTQNACGGTARDIQMHGMQNVRRKGYPIVMHTYDETVAEIEDRNDPGLESSDYVSYFELGLNDLPAYSKGWPIFARGGWIGPRYGKWD